MENGHSKVEDVAFWSAILAGMGFLGLHIGEYGNSFMFSVASIIGLSILWLCEMRRTEKVKYFLLITAFWAGNGITEIFLRSWAEFWLTVSAIGCAFIAGVLFSLEWK